MVLAFIRGVWYGICKGQSPYFIYWEAASNTAALRSQKPNYLYLWTTKYCGRADMNLHLQQ